MILLNSLTPGGVRRLYVDSVFMLPHLGVLSEHHPDAAMDVLLGDCLVPLGTSARPLPSVGRRGVLPLRVPEAGEVIARLVPDAGDSRQVTVGPGELALIPLGPGLTGDLTLQPAAGQDFGAGPGRPFSARAAGGEVGVIIDNRGNPGWSGEGWPGPERAETVRRWMTALGCIPRPADSLVLSGKGAAAR